MSHALQKWQYKHLLKIKDKLKIGYFYKQSHRERILDIILWAFLIQQFIIPLALVEYEMIIANSAHSTISYLTCTHAIIVK